MADDGNKRLDNAVDNIQNHTRLSQDMKDAVITVAKAAPLHSTHEKDPYETVIAGFPNNRGIDAQRIAAFTSYDSAGYEIVGAVDDIAKENSNKSIPENVKLAVQKLALAGGMDVKSSSQALDQITDGEKKIVASNMDSWLHKDRALNEQGYKELYQARENLANAIGKGLASSDKSDTAAVALPTDGQVKTR